jgi:hypothetical protein
MRFIFFITVLFLVSCKDGERNPRVKGESDFIKTEKEPGENQVLNVILLENGFNQDTVRILADDKVLFEGIITTDPRSGSAIALELSDSFKVLDFQMNKWNKKIGITDSIFIHINKIATDSIEVIYNDKFGGYY